MLPLQLGIWPHTACPVPGKHGLTEQRGAANPNCAGSQSCYGGKGLSSRIPIPRLPAIFIPTQLTANAGGFLGLRWALGTPKCAVLPRTLLAVGFISLCYGTGQLQMVWATLRQNGEGRNDWSLFEKVMSSVSMSVVLLRETHYPYIKTPNCYLLSS